MLIASEIIENESYLVGELITVVNVRAANIAKDIRENIRNLVGGRMKHYEDLIDTALTEALLELEEKAKEKKYDGVIGVKISNPLVVDGGVEIIAYGNGYTLKNK